MHVERTYLRWTLTCWFVLAASWLLWNPTVASAGDVPAEQLEFFEKQIRPILITHCAECHGEKKQEAGLRLDRKADALRGSDVEPVIKPGDPHESPLIAAVRYETYEMPPDAKLSDEQIAALEKWVELGAPWPDDGTDKAVDDRPASPESIARARREHWAFQPVKEPAVPAVANTDWVRSPIDAFVSAQLEEAGMEPSPEADKRTLLRRLYYDVTGLPPTFDEIATFVADQSPDAVERVVDKLLASPAYGERWARHWLDVARYGDAQGFRAGNTETRYPFAYTYRDYVVRSLNEDLPFDQFVREQLAADLLPTQRDPRALAALGFLTVGPRFNGALYDILDDRIDVVTRGMMGLTVSCARCHDHKFDPIPTADYYSLLGIFYSAREEPEELPLIEEPADTPEYRAYAEELAQRQQKVDELIEQERVKLLVKIRSLSGNYLLSTVKELYPGAMTAELNGRLDELKSDIDVRFTRRWIGHLRRSLNRHDPIFTPWHALAKLPPEAFATQADETLAKLWEAADQREDRRINARLREALQANPPQSLVELADVYGRVLSEVDQQAAKLREELPTGEPLQLDKPTQELYALLFGDDAPAELKSDQIEPSFSVDIKNKIRGLRREVAKWQVESPHAPERAMVVRDVANPHDVRIFIRGVPGRPGDVAPRRFLEVLAGDERPHFKEGSGRLQLAEAIASRDNPLTPRVIVNRVWKHYFGAGLVRTPSNFGLQGDPPTHPELLDWLTARFLEEGWSLKKLHRTILLSATYAQQSQLRPEYDAVDPENRLLWRMHRKRLEYEPLRDTLLAVSGALDRTVGGRAFDLGAQPFVGRRTIYGLIDRQFLFGALPTFDFPSPEVSAAERPRTTVPQQALYLMNSPFVVEQAKRLAARPEVQAAASPSERMQVLYRLALQREADAEELAHSEAFITRLQEIEKQEGQTLDAWQMFAQILLMSNELMFVD